MILNKDCLSHENAISITEKLLDIQTSLKNISASSKEMEKLLSVLKSQNEILISLFNFKEV
ncbi:hypothetical protein [uncultured Sneathia sp.]|jgi:hypothetical protein|uniref:hypothetical protein n=1 Tax=uncultured Sneathia sp. TaxID=278067 RepID=UPI00204D9744|nr:hypothetical protein [uncultured Sneathia sp.]DAM85308.1 MAG TPA: hypothetical protein [Caudoviricetes sp.]